jgi:hypothetical protein
MVSGFGSKSKLSCNKVSSIGTVCREIPELSISCILDLLLYFARMP